jgi:hypothetical protein
MRTLCALLFVVATVGCAVDDMELAIDDKNDSIGDRGVIPNIVGVKTLDEIDGHWFHKGKVFVSKVEDDFIVVDTEMLIVDSNQFSILMTESKLWPTTMAFQVYVRSGDGEGWTPFDRGMAQSNSDRNQCEDLGPHDKLHRVFLSSQPSMAPDSLFPDSRAGWSCEILTDTSSDCSLERLTDPTAFDQIAIVPYPIWRLGFIFEGYYDYEVTIRHDATVNLGPCAPGFWESLDLGALLDGLTGGSGL